MDSSTVLRSFQPSVGTVSHARSLLERPGMLTTSRKLYVQGFGGKLISSPTKQKSMIVSCLKTSESTKTTDSSDNVPRGSLEKNSLQNATFPTGFEALVLEVCDETEIAELKLKIGDFEMHMKRNIEAKKAPVSFVPPPVAPPTPSKPTTESIPDKKPSSPPKPSSASMNPFKDAVEEKPRKLLALEASGATGYVFVDSPAVGTFRRGRLVKGRMFPPVRKEGDLVKEGQVIGYVDRFGTQIAVRSDKAGEILKFLYDEGDAVGYGDHIIAVFPSFSMK